MPRPPMLVALLALALTCGLVRTAEAAPTFAYAPAPRYVIHLAPDMDLGTARARLADAGLSVHTTVDCAQALVVDAAGDNHALAKIAKLAGITGLEPDYPQPASLATSRPLPARLEHTKANSAPSTLPNDEFFPDQWNVRAISAPDAWDYTTGATDALTTVAILDTGIDLDHPDLGGSVYLDAAWNFYDNNRDVQDISPSGSGTMVAGIIAATANNGFGIAGLAWSPQIIPIKVIGWDAAHQIDVFYWSDVAAGICHAVNRGARVIHISAYHRNLAGAGGILTTALTYANDRGAIVVAPVGDERQFGNPMEYPAGYIRLVIGVGAVDSTNNIWEHSNTGQYVDLVAPGVDVVTTVPMALDEVGARYGTGTLLAAAHVSGVALLMRSVNPVLSPFEIADILRQKADDLGSYGPDVIYGAGLVNALNAVKGTPHRLTVSPADLMTFEWDPQSQTYRQPLQTVWNNHTGARTWRTTSTTSWLQVNEPTNAAPIGSTPSLASISVAPPGPGECNTRAAYVRAESQMPNKANGPQNILVRVVLPACPESPFAVFLPLIQHSPPRPVNTSR